MKKPLAILIALLSIIGSMAQSLSPTVQISVLTIGPGESLNDAFGHNAFRIQDKALGMDVVFGYGEYDFDTPNFYLKFAQGKLNYQISKDNFADFYYAYASIYNRTIQEQVLNLSPEEKQNLYSYLVNNYKPENRKYLYDFFYDNCATRIRDVAKIAIENDIQFRVPENFHQKTFRRLIHDHTGRNNWGSFGIDIALGSVIDKKATPYEHMFLPTYIHDFFGHATLNTNNNLVNTSSTLYIRKESPESNNFFLSPLFILGILGAIIMYLTYQDYTQGKRTKWLDVTLFAVTGLVGTCVLLLWFATDHSATSNNYNLLWAFPLNILVIGQLLKPQASNWFKKYLNFLVIMLCLLTLHWIIGVQIFAIGLIPLLIAIAVRYIFLIHHYTNRVSRES